MVELDLRGYECPMPVVKVMKAMEKNPDAILKIWVDKASAVDDIARYAAKKKYAAHPEKIDREFLVTLSPEQNS
jgi:tRNA 2-thiouridine synthesizing protein A